jgi:hypothetical protein
MNTKLNSIFGSLLNQMVNVMPQNENVTEIQIALRLYLSRLQAKLKTCVNQFPDELNGNRDQKTFAYRFYKLVLCQPDVFNLVEYCQHEKERGRSGSAQLAEILYSHISGWKAYRQDGSMVWGNIQAKKANDEAIMLSTAMEATRIYYKGKHLTRLLQ